MTAYYNLISRKDAAVAGFTRYFTGRPCKRGHIAERFVSTKTCCECNTVRNASENLVSFRREYYAKQYSLNREAILERGKRYNSTEMGRASIVVRTSRRRASQINAEGVCTPEEAMTIRKAQKDRCAYCASKLNGKGSLDHIVALSKGGSNWPFNLQWLCRSCNSRKHTKDPIDFAQQIGKLL
jgi:5-methylcytosine-specific restriction endonuclease McrA